jgi:hypothetical protein
VLRFAYAALSLRSHNLPRGQYIYKTLHLRCKTAIHVSTVVLTRILIEVDRQIRLGHNAFAWEVDGGDRRDRTDDLKLAKLPLYQLSYVPS